MKTLKELEKDYLEKKEVYENAVTALAHSGSNKVEVKNAAEILDSSYDNVKIKFTKMDRLFFTNLDRII